MLVGMLVVPFYLDALGAEAYGLVAFYSLVLMLFELCDFGLRATVTRESARTLADGSSKVKLCGLVLTFERVVFGVGVALCIAAYISREAVATNVLNVNTLRSSDVGSAFFIMVVIASINALQLIYFGVLTGVGELVVVNRLKSFALTFSSIGGVWFVTFSSGGIVDLFIWQLVVSIFFLAICRVSAQRYLEKKFHEGAASISAVAEVSRFSSGSMAIGILGSLFSQADKLIFTALLSLEDFGYYMLSHRVAAVLLLVVDPIWRSFYPKFVVAYSANKTTEFARHFHMASKLVMVAVGPILALIILHGEWMIGLWLPEQSPVSFVYKLAVAIALGHFCNVLQRVTYASQLAAGWTSFGVYLSILGILIYVPALYVIMELYGLNYAVWLWCILNIIFFIATYCVMFRRILKGEGTKWLIQDVLMPTVLLAVTLVLLIAFGQAVQLPAMVDAIISVMVIVISQFLFFYYCEAGFGYASKAG